MTAQIDHDRGQSLLLCIVDVLYAGSEKLKSVVLDVDVEVDVKIHVEEHVEMRQVQYSDWKNLTEHTVNMLSSYYI